MLCFTSCPRTARHSRGTAHEKRLVARRRLCVSVRARRLPVRGARMLRGVVQCALRAPGHRDAARQRRRRLPESRRRHARRAVPAAVAPNHASRRRPGRRAHFGAGPNHRTLPPCRRAHLGHPTGRRHAHAASRRPMQRVVTGRGDARARRPSKLDGHERGAPPDRARNHRRRRHAIRHGSAGDHSRVVRRAGSNELRVGDARARIRGSALGRYVRLRNARRWDCVLARRPSRSSSDLPGWGAASIACSRAAATC